jgi:poly(A) polymerase
MLITNTDQLIELCSLIKKQHKIIALDTEFERIATYYPVLSLVQIALQDGKSWVIDALACPDLTPLIEILTTKDIVKVLHAGMQDFEIFRNLFAICPENILNIFDTQIAALFTGEEEQLSYARLVKKYFNQELDKSLQFSKWLRRPLTTKHLEYALTDVAHLIPLYGKLKKQLGDKYEWAVVESTAQNLANSDKIEWNVLISKVILRLSKKQILLYCLLAHYRNEEGKKRNISRRKIISDAAMLDIAKHQQLTKSTQKNLHKEDITKISAILEEKYFAKSFIEEVNYALSSYNKVNMVAYQAAISLLSEKAKQHGLAQKLLVNKQEVQNYLGGRKSNLAIGWRYNIMGNLLDNLKNLPAWLPYEQLCNLFGILSAKGEVRLVGGCVRDILVNKRSVDIDIATTVLPHEVEKLLNDNNIKCIPTGIEFGTVTAVIEGRHFEITTLREDISCDGRHAKVVFTQDWYQDALRRDFTVNAMSMDIQSGKVYDYFGGQEDLEQKLIKFVGAPAKRIKEDYLRILRYFRFYAYFGGDKIDLPSLEACQKYAQGLQQISGERIQKEMFLLLSAPFAYQAVVMMAENGLMPWLQFPEIKAEVIPPLAKIPIVNIAAILRAVEVDNNYYELLSKRWRLSKKNTKLLKLLCTTKDITIEDNTAKHHAWIFTHGKQNYVYLMELMQLEKPSKLYKQRLQEAQDWQIPSFPLDGNDVIALGINGKEVGLQLNYAKNSWIKSNFTLQREKLLEMIIDQHEKKDT